VDFKAPRGTPVYAAGPGVVMHARRKGSYGKLIIISHGLGLETRYAHLSRIKVDEGEFVPAGALIGTVGSTGRTTGPHLHFEVRQFEEPVDPLWALGETRPSIADELVAAFRWLKVK
jgi:murein DD-endopeptidase MepM/ murein hydrolase activator NlpD